MNKQREWPMTLQIKTKYKVQKWVIKKSTFWLVLEERGMTLYPALNEYDDQVPSFTINVQVGNSQNHFFSINFFYNRFQKQKGMKGK